jgi:uncharacterized protein (DUF2249 family)
MDERRPNTNRRDRPSESPGVTATLAEQHAQLLSEVSARAHLLLLEVEEDRWPILPLRELADYFHVEVLQQVVDDEWLLFRSAHHAPEELAGLRRSHLELRLAIDVLAQAAAGAGDLSPPQLAVTTQGVLALLRDHLVAEERVLGLVSEASQGVRNFNGAPSECQPLTRGQVIDLDALRGGPGFDAVLERLVTMKPGETVELRAGIDFGPLWQRLTRIDPGGYGIELLQNGPTQWGVEITCRPGR